MLQPAPGPALAHIASVLPASVQYSVQCQDSGCWSGRGESGLPAQSLSHVWLFENPQTVALGAFFVHGIFKAGILEWIREGHLKGMEPAQTQVSGILPALWVCTVSPRGQCWLLSIPDSHPVPTLDNWSSAPSATKVIADRTPWSKYDSCSLQIQVPHRSTGQR